MNVTISAIAKDCGVSRATVSLALRAHSRISATTRARVAVTARKLGYRPHYLVSAHMATVRAGRKSPLTSPVYYVIPDASEEIFGLLRADGGRGRSEALKFARRIPDFDAAMLGFEGAVRRAGSVGWGLRLVLLSNRHDEAVFGRQVNRIRGAGIILAPCYGRAADLTLRWNQFVTAALDGFMPEQDFHRVRYDVFADTRDLIGRIASLGYNRCGIAISRNMIARGLGGSLASFMLSQAEIHPQLRIPPLIMDGGDGGAIARWAKRYKPQAIIGHDFGVLQASLRGAGLVIPRDVGYAEVGPAPELSNRSCFHEDPQRLGAAAFDLLHAEYLGGKDVRPGKPKLIVLRGKWRDGETLPSLEGIGAPAQRCG